MSSSIMSLLAGVRPKRTRLGANSTAGESSASLVGTGNAGAISDDTPQVPANPPPTRTFAQAASGGSAKRSGPAPPAFPRPQLRRGEPLIQDTNYASMERPAPPTPAPNVLYVDMRNSSLSPEEVLEAAFPVLGKHVIGFQLFAAQKTLGLVFASAESCTLHRNQTIGETGLMMYPAPATPVNLLKLTLQGVPFWDAAGVVAALPSILQPYGELVFLAPMVTASGWTSDQWHATISRAPDNMALPPETIELLGQQVIVDVPAQRRYCRHCESSIHVKPSCRQGARQRQRQNQLAKDAAAVAAARAQRLRPASLDPTRNIRPTSSHRCTKLPPPTNLCNRPPTNINSAFLPRIGKIKLTTWMPPRQGRCHWKNASAAPPKSSPHALRTRVPLIPRSTKLLASSWMRSSGLAAPTSKPRRCPSRSLL